MKFGLHSAWHCAYNGLVWCGNVGTATLWQWGSIHRRPRLVKAFHHASIKGNNGPLDVPNVSQRHITRHGTCGTFILVYSVLHYGVRF